MGYSTSVATSLNNALELTKDWFVTSGWTSNSFIDDTSKYAGDVFTGKRLHVQKTVGSTTAYLNFRSCSNQKVFSASAYDLVTGICCYPSTEYSGVKAWDAQLMFATTATTGGCVDTMLTSGINCHFFSANSGAQISVVYECDNDEWFGFISGITSNPAVYGIAASGGTEISSSGLFYRKNLLVSTDFSTDFGNNRSIYLDTNNTIINIPDGREFPMFEVSPQFDSYNISGHLVRASGGSINGSTPLFPPYIINWVDATETRLLWYLPGVKLVNMTGHFDGEEITIGSDTYRLYHSRQGEFFGVAFLK